MEGSDEFSNDDVWSPSLREELFADYNLSQSWDNNANDLFLPRFSLLHPSVLDRATPSQHQGTAHTGTTGALNTSMPYPSGTTSQTRKSSHLDLPNFPLATDPTNTSSTSSARVPPPPQLPSTQPGITTTSPIREPPHPSASLLPDTESSNLDTSFEDSERSDTFWSESDEGNLDDFVDLTQDASPPTMPPAPRPRSRIPHTIFTSTSPRRGDVLRPEGTPSSTQSNPAKRRKIGNEVSQSSHRPREVEGIDLTGVDDDKALSKVLEQQRIATIKAQQEQASKPVKLSTIQCIICMENMTDITATSCGTLTSILVFIYAGQLIRLLCRSSLLPFLPHGSSYSRRESRRRAWQGHSEMSSVSEEGH